jgi:hypothetical protein
MELPLLTDNDRQAHPHISDIGVQAVLLLNNLSDMDLLDLLREWEASQIFVGFKELFGSGWVLNSLFLWNTARDIGVNRKEIKKAVEEITPPYRRSK